MNKVEVPLGEMGDGICVRGDPADLELRAGRIDELVDPVGKDLVADAGQAKERGGDVDFGQRCGVRSGGRAGDLHMQRKGSEQSDGSAEAVSDNLDVLDGGRAEGSGGASPARQHAGDDVGIGARGGDGVGEYVEQRHDGICAVRLECGQVGVVHRRRGKVREVLVREEPGREVDEVLVFAVQVGVVVDIRLGGKEFEHVVDRGERGEG